MKLLENFLKIDHKNYVGVKSRQKIKEKFKEIKNKKKK